MSIRAHIKLAIGIAVLLIPLVGNSSGWNDYILDIGDGFRIVRTNSFDKGLDGPNRIRIFHHNYPEIGPLVRYYKDSKNVFVKTIGWKYRNLFEGDSFKEHDFSKEYYFIVSVLDSSVEGPYLKSQFETEAKNLGFGSIDWVKPKNPNFWTPLLGTLMFLAIAIPFLFIKYWIWTLPITAVSIYLVVRWKNKRHNKASKNADGGAAA